MTPKREAILGGAIWFKGVLLMIGVTYYRPSFGQGVFIIGLLLVILGVVLLYTAVTDYLADDFHEDIKKEYKP